MSRIAARVIVDLDLCAGVAMCVRTVPDLFALDTNGQSRYLGGGTEDELSGAVDSCPMAALRWERGDG